MCIENLIQHFNTYQPNCNADQHANTAFNIKPEDPANVDIVIMDEFANSETTYAKTVEPFVSDKCIY